MHPYKSAFKPSETQFPDLIAGCKGIQQVYRPLPRPLLSVP